MTVPDSRYYVHASTQAARAQQGYLVEEASRPVPRSDHHVGGPRFDARTDWWIVVAVVALVAGSALLVAIVR